MSNLSKTHRLKTEFPPTVLTIFGATGDLSLNYLLPTLIHMDSEGLLGSNFHLVLVGRRALTLKSYVKLLLDKTNAKIDQKLLNHFLKRVRYVKANIDDPESFSALHGALADKQLSAKKHQCFNRLYYFATSPNLFVSVARSLKQEGLLIGCQEHNRTIRVLVEKPFGNNLASAKALNKELLRFFKEDQIYRIDHYLGKETVQNLLVARFANDFLEPIWNKDHIDHLEISVLENVGVGNRVNFYDTTGALKDLVQNHILQILALIAMEQPKDLSPNSIRNEKVKVLEALPKFNQTLLKNNIIRGQYNDYQKEVGKPSQTETYVAFQTSINNKRWKGVPFYLRTGKRLGRKVAEVSVHFKKRCQLFGTDRAGNILTFRIQPDESVQMQINNKIPGFGINLHAGKLDFGYKTAFLTEMPSAYERLFLDFIQGDQRLFIRSDEIEASWKFVDSIIKNWNNINAPLQKYVSGSNGPKLSEKLVSKNNHLWWTK
jgi:glucose-6-phosphate 1-dehydrogenase